ncbi:MAG: hypothetical protein GDA44_03805 [Prochloron sp. SP5CPC1]|nr:hypothetical protein [Candidatus Paraprochloron terpiosi SP5CPC1]
MDQITNKTLLALMLALRDLETPLNELERLALAEAADQLSLDPDLWSEDIEPNLIATIEASGGLNSLFQKRKSQLEAVSGNIPADLLPTATELEAVLPQEEAVMTRGFDPVLEEGEEDTDEINNMAISIMATRDPAATAKKLSGFERLKNFLSS